MVQIDYMQVKQDHTLFDILEKNLGPSRSRNKTGEWSCPFHASRGAEGTPSFKMIPPDFQQAKCFGCGWSGDLFDFLKEYQGIENDQEVLQSLGYVLETGLTSEEMKAKSKQFARERETRQRASAEQQKQKTQTILDKIAGMDNVAQAYHDNLTEGSPGLKYWGKQGFSGRTIDRYKLGYALQCPVDHNSPSYTIPIYREGKLLSIRHRLQFPNGKGSYRPQFSGLPAQLFNVDRLTYQDECGFEILPAGQAILVEGEKKAIRLDQQGLKVAGLPGLATWKSEWLMFFRHLSEIIICFDPDVDRDIAKKRIRWNLAQDLKGAGLKVKICRMPFKPDDFFTLHGGTINEFIGFMNWAREVK